MTPLIVHEMAEWSPLSVSSHFTAEDQPLLEAFANAEQRRLSIQELRDGIRFESYSWVGVVRFTNFELRIVPRLAGAHEGLVRMIEFASGIDAFRRTPFGRTLDVTGANLFDLIACLFAEACDDVARRGIIADYSDREEGLTAVRGRMLPDRQVLNRYAVLDRIECRFDEHEQDIVENQILALALRACVRQVQDNRVKRMIHRQLAVFEAVADPASLDVQNARASIHYTRLTEYYRTAHMLGWLILEGQGVHDLLAQGTTRTFTFLLDMNLLFERFVYRMVERLVGMAGGSVEYQKSHRSILWDAIAHRPYSRVIPDLLVTRPPSTPGTLPVDAKYKPYDDRKLAPSDVYQAFVYAFALGTVQVGLPQALVIYPARSGQQPTTRLHVRQRGRASAEITALGVSIPAALNELEAGDIGSTLRPLYDAVR